MLEEKNKIYKALISNTRANVQKYDKRKEVNKFFHKNKKCLRS